LNNENRERTREMESIGEILSQRPGLAAGRLGERDQTKKTRTEECECHTCGTRFEGEVSTYVIAGRTREFWPWECPACKEKREAEEERERQAYLEEARREEREKWRRQSGISDDLMNRTFGNFENSWQDRSLKVCRKYAEGFKLEEARGYRSLILHSEKPGLGKTHFMVSIANYIIDNWNGEPGRLACPIRFESGPGLVRRIRATYNLPQADWNHEREEDIYAQLRGVKLLMLDDVGKEKPSDFTRELYWYVIDERVKSGLPIVMSCRLPLEGENSLEKLMGEDTVDRLYGMTHGHIETLKGQSYRRIKGVA